MAARGFLGSGDLYIDRIVAGVKQGFEGPFEVTEFSIKPNSDVRELVSRSKDNYGSVIESVPLAQPADFTIRMSEVNRSTMALALMGTVADLSQGVAGTITGHAAGEVKLDRWFQLPKANLTGAVTVTSDPAGTTFVEGTDYIVNRDLGWIKPLSTGDIAEGADLLIGGAYGTTVGVRIAGGTQAELRAAFMLDGRNQADGTPCIVNVWEGIIAPDDAFDFMAAEFATVALPGRMKRPVGKTEAFTVDLRTPT